MPTGVSSIKKERSAPYLHRMVIALRTSQSFRERAGALSHLPPFPRLVWDSSPALTLASFTLRLVRAVVPVLMLYVGKLIVDAVVAEARLPHAEWPLAQWIESGRLVRPGELVVLEFGLAVMADFSGRFSSLVDSLLAETYSNFASIRLMEKAASLDLEQFESSDQQDRLDRARRQVASHFFSRLASRDSGQCKGSNLRNALTPGARDRDRDFFVSARENLGKAPAHSVCTLRPAIAHNPSNARF